MTYKAGLKARRLTKIWSWESLAWMLFKVKGSNYLESELSTEKRTKPWGVSTLSVGKENQRRSIEKKQPEGEGKPTAGCPASHLKKMPQG